MNDAFVKQSIFHILDGLREGLCHFSNQSRVALIFCLSPDSPMHIYDPQNLLRGHEPKLEELYLESSAWRGDAPEILESRFVDLFHSESLPLAGLISFGGKARSVFYQMWFTEHHPDMCSIGPTERWLERANWLLAQDLTGKYRGASTAGYVLQGYAAHAVRDHIVDERNVMIGPDTQLRVYPILDAVLGVSKTLEEGESAHGRLVFVEPRLVGRVPFLVKFPEGVQPKLKNFKHVRKLLQSVEHSDKHLVSNGEYICGVSAAEPPPTSIRAEFRGGYGFVWLDNELVCSFYDGAFHSSTRKAKLVQVEEGLLEAQLDPGQGTELFKVVSRLVHSAQEAKHGCTVIIDLNDDPLTLSGQALETPLDLRDEDNLDLACALGKIDGALHLAKDITLRGFACLLDGRAVAGENRSRGARFNSALRFTSENERIIVVVVSADRPVSIIQSGVELTALCEWKPFSGCVSPFPTLEEWIG